MKPILVWCPHATIPSGYSQHGTTRVILEVLNRFNVPYELRGGLNTEGPAEAGFDETAYSVAILPWGNTGTTGHKSWLNGSRTIPVVATDLYGATSLVRYTGCDTGITARGSGGAGAFQTMTAEGLSLCWVATSEMYTLNADPLVAESVLASSEATANVGIARLIAPVGGSEVYYIPWGSYNSYMTRMLVVLQALKLTGETPRPLTLRIDIDDAPLLTATKVQGLYDFADWLRAKRAVAIITLPREISAPVAPVRECIIANSDVFRCTIHSHTDAPFLDDVTYPDIPTKLTRHAEEVAFYRAQGYTVYPAGPSGHINLPDNTCSRIGQNALMVLGVKALRGSRIAVEYAGEPDTNRICTFKQGEVRYWLRLQPNVPLVAEYTVETKAGMYTAYGATGDAIKAAAYMIMSGGSVAGDMLSVLSKGKRTIWCHASNFADDGTASADNPGLAWFNILDQMVQFSGGWMKWANDADLERWGARPMRRVGIGSAAD